MNSSKWVMTVLGLVLALTMAFPVSAGTITGVASVSGGGTAVVTPIITTFPGNDDVAVPGGNIVVASKVFNSASPIDIVFNVAASNGLITEYYIAEGVANNTSSAMTGYVFQLGFGTGDDFVLSASGDGLDFDILGDGATTGQTPTPTSGAFSVLVHGEDVLTWSSGSLGVVVSDAFTLSIDVPDGLDGGQFTLRQWGTPVPEPGTLALAAMIGCALAAVGLRKSLG